MRLWRWLRGLLVPDRWPSPPERLIDLPGQLREPSADLLRRLRELDPRAEVVYVGEGRWWVGRVKQNVPRIQRGRAMAVRILDGDGLYDEFGQPVSQWPELRQALLMAQGFGLADEVRVQGEPDDKIVAVFREFTAGERGHRIDPVVRKARNRRISDIERELYTWLFKRSPKGRGDSMIGYGGGVPLANRRVDEREIATLIGG